jgi:hypothetical protein
MYIVGEFSSDHLLFYWPGPFHLPEITVTICLKRQKAFVSKQVCKFYMNKDTIMEHI